MAVNNRIFYACQAVAFVPSGTAAVAPGHVVHGVQSVGITSNFSLEQAFEFGQVEIYANSEEVGEVEVTCEKLIDGSVGLYVHAAHAQGTNVVTASSKRTDVFLAIYDDTVNAVAATAKKDVVACSGMSNIVAKRPQVNPMPILRLEFPYSQQLHGGRTNE